MTSYLIVHDAIRYDNHTYRCKDCGCWGMLFPIRNRFSGPNTPLDPGEIWCDDPLAAILEVHEE